MSEDRDFLKYLAESREKIRNEMSESQREYILALQKRFIREDLDKKRAAVRKKRMAAANAVFASKSTI